MSLKMKQLYNTEHYSKGAIQFLLSLFLLTNGLHLSDHDHSAVEGYSICNPGCDKPNHHSIEDSCKECLNNSKKQKLFLNSQSSSMFGTPYITLVENYSTFTNNINFHYFGSRAPPNLL